MLKSIIKFADLDIEQKDRVLSQIQTQLVIGGFDSVNPSDEEVIRVYFESGINQRLNSELIDYYKGFDGVEIDIEPTDVAEYYIKNTH